MAYTKITFARPDIPKGLNSSGGLMRQHYRAKMALEKKFLLLCRLKGFEKHLAQVRVKITYTTVRKRDWDNLAASGKIVLDQLVKLGCIIDDSPKIIPDPPEYKQIKVSSYSLVRWTIEIFDL